MNSFIRRFIRHLTMCALVAGTIIGCKEDAPTIPDIKDDLEAIITGPDSSLVLSHEGSEVFLDGTESIGAVSYQWSRTDDEFKKDLGIASTALDTLFKSDKYTYSLIVSNKSGESDSASLDLLAYPIPATNEIYAIYGTVGLEAKIDLVTINPDNFGEMNVVIEYFASKYFDSNSFSLEPNGNRLAIGDNRGTAMNLTLYNLRTGELEVLIKNSGVTHNAKWSPTGEWIAYVDNVRAGNELAFINPHTGEQFYASGDKVDSLTYGQKLDWNATGDEIAMGSTTDYNEDGERLRRVQIYYDLFSGNVKRRRLHSEEYLQEYFFDKFGAKDATWIQEGAAGVSWDPRGELIAYSVVGSKLWASGIAVAKADGSGIQYVIIDHPGYDHFYWRPTWSPDGEYLMFTGLLPRKLYRINRDGTNFTNLSNEYGYGKNFVVATWGD
ncbi:hypothetical protein ACFLS9_01210 [Bacteroidota bacterium]